MRVLTVIELSNVKWSENLEDGFGEVDRGGVLATWAVIGDNSIDVLVLPGNPDRLTAVRGHGVTVPVSTLVESDDKITVGVNLATGTRFTILLVPCESKIEVKT